MTSQAFSHSRPGFATVVRSDARRTMPLVAGVSGGVLVLVLLGCLLGWAIPVISPLIFMFAFLAAGTLVFGVQVIMGVFFYTTMVGREAPVTRTWPLSGRTLFAGKFTNGMMAVLLSTVAAVVMMAAALAFTSPSGRNELGTVVDATVRGFSTEPLLMIGGLIWIVFGLVSSIVMFYFSSLVGSRGWLGKLGIGGPIIVVFVLWAVVYQLLSFVALLIPLSLNMETFEVEFVSLLFALMDSGGAGDDLPYLPLAVVAIQVQTCAVLIGYCIWDSSRTRDIA